MWFGTTLAVVFGGEAQGRGQGLPLSFCVAPAQKIWKEWSLDNW